MLPAPIPPDDELRLSSLRELNLLDTLPEERYDRLTRLARELFDVPIALVSLVDRDRQWFKSKQGLEASEMPRDISFCGHAIASDGPLIIPDASVDPRFADNPLVAEDPSIRFYAGVPLLAPDGQKIGTLCLIDSKPHELTGTQVQQLVKLARLVEEQISVGSVLRRGRMEAEREGFLRELKGSTRGIRRRAVGAFLAAAVLLISFTTFAFSVMRELGGDIDDVASARESISAVSDMMVAVQSVETGARGYALTGQKRFLESYSAGKIELRTALGTLRRISAEEESLSLELNKARVYAERSGDISARIVSARRSRGLQVAVAEVGKTSNFSSMNSLRHLSRALDAAINARMHERTERLTHRAVKLGSTLAASCLLAVFLLGWSLLEVDRNSQARILAQAEATRAASALQAVFDSATAVAIIATDPDGLIRVFNRGAENMLGYSALEMVSRNTPVRIHVPAEIEARGVELTKSLGKEVRGFSVFVEPASHGSSDAREWTYVRKDGTRFPVELIITAIHDGQQNIVGYLEFATDITAQKQVREDLARARDLAVKAADMKSQFLANMSHEIRTPLNAIMGMASLLAEGEFEPRHRKFITAIREASDGLLAVINDVLDYSKIEAGMLTLEKIPFDLGAIITGSVGIVSQRALAKGLEMIVDISPDARLTVKGDPMRLRQVLLNLLSNAIKFTEMGRVLVRAGAASSADGRARIRISVRDSGIGIPIEAQALLFKSFSQADSSTTRRFGGTGLGLAISKQIVELSGGRIGVVSAAGEGSEFWLEIPFELTADAPKRNDPPAFLKGLRVLIIDDIAVNRDIFVEQFTAWGMLPTVADSGRTALEVMRRAAQEKRPFKLAVLDFQMPGMDGMALARAIKADPALSTTKCVLVSSSAEVHTPAHLRENGLADSLLKPVNASVLLECVLRVMAVSEKTEATKTPLRPTRRMRILVVDDNKTNRTVLQLQLNKLGYAADDLSSAVEALKLLPKKPYDLIFLDCQMPDMDGYEASRLIRERAREWLRRPIVAAMTASTLAQDRERCAAAGMDDYLSKPVNSDLLASLLTRWDVPLRAEIIDELKRLSGDRFQDMAQNFAGDFRRYLGDIRAAFAKGDADEIRRLAHGLRGASASFGAFGMANLCELLEMAARPGGAEKLPAIISELTEECSRVERALGNL